jgi:hypothetical protein
LRGPKLPEIFYQKAITFGIREQGITCEPEKEFELISLSDKSFGRSPSFSLVLPN